MCRKIFFLIFFMINMIGIGYAQQKPAARDFRFKNSVYPSDNSNIRKTVVSSGDSLPLIHNDFLINNLSGNYNSDAWYPDIARDTTGSYAMAWIDLRMGFNQIYVQFFNSEDKPIGNNIRVSEEWTEWNNRPVIACNKKGDYVVAWSDDNMTILAQRFTKNGSKIGNNFKINNNSYMNISNPSVAVASNGSFAISYSTDNYSGSYDLFTMFFDHSGSRITNDIKINYQLGGNISSFGWGKQIAVNGHDNFLVVWSSFYKNKSEIFAQQLDKWGNLMGDNFIVSDTLSSLSYTFPTVGASDGAKFFAAYESNGVYGRIIDDSGQFISDEFSIFSQSYSWLPTDVNLYKDSLFIASWTGSDFGYRIIDTEGNFVTQVMNYNFEDGETHYGNYATLSRMLNDGFYITFFEDIFNSRIVRLQKYSMDLKPAGGLIDVSDAKFSSWQNSPLVHTNTNGISIVLWNDKRNGRTDLYARLFDENFEPLGDDFMVNKSHDSYFYLIEKTVISLSEGTFIVGYLARMDDWWNVYLQKISQSGVKVGQPVIACRIYASASKISINSNGNDNIAVVWYISSSGYCMWRKYDPNLTALSEGKNIFKNNSGYSFNSVSFNINQELKTFAVWAPKDNSTSTSGEKILSLIYDENGELVSDTTEIFSIVYNNSSINDLTASYDNMGNITLLWQENGVLNYYRKLNSENNYSYERIYHSYLSQQQVIFAKNNKVFLTYTAGQDIYYKLINDNTYENKEGLLFRLPSFDRYSLRYYTSNDASIFNNKLFLVYESNRSGNTGYDIWGNVTAVEFADTSKEYFFEKVRDEYIYPVYPNPVNSVLTIPYRIFSYHDVNVSVYDILGRKVKELLSKPQESGIYRISFDTSNLSSGVYFIRLSAFNTKVVKFIVMK